MKSKLSLVISIIVVALAIVGIIIFVPLGSPSPEELPTYDSNSALAATIDLSDLNTSSILPASDLNGNIADHVKGNASAPVILYEYADYQCSGCATVNPWVKELLNEYGDDLGIVFRSYPLNVHPMPAAASAAVEAAGLQGYWHEYGDLLFANQAEWYYSSDTKLINYFVTYFKAVAGDSGDVKKFRSDLFSESVKQKIAFDTAIGNSLDVDGTPSFFDKDGNLIDWYSANTKSSFISFFENYIDAELEKAKK